MRPALFAVLAPWPVQAVHELCGTFEQYRVNNYTWNNNAWNDDGSGWVCTYVSDIPDEESNAFYVSWEWTGQPVVRGFPHVALRTKQLPVRLSDLRSLSVAASWELSPASLIEGASADPNTEPNASALQANHVQANVCVDVFADQDRERSLDSSEQQYEVMIWFGHFGTAALPVGNTALLDPPIVILIQDTEFKLYTGTNHNGQIVYTWVANRTLTIFDMDLAPLFGFLAAKDMVPIDVYLGTVQFGTEIFSAENQVNFSVKSFEASVKTKNDSIVTGTDSDLENGTGPVSTSLGGVPVATQLANPTSAASLYPVPLECSVLALICCLLTTAMLG